MMKPHLGFDARKIRDYGIGTYIQGLLPRLWQYGGDRYRWTVFVHPKDIRTSLLGNHQPSCLDWVPIREGTYNLMGTYAFRRKLMNRKLDLLHVPHFPVPACRPTRLVITLHDTILLDYGQGIRDRWVAGIARRWMKHAIQRADRVLTVSHASARSLAGAFDLDTERLTVVHNGLPDGYRVPPSASDIRRWRHELNLPDHGYFLFVGNPKPHKNLDRLIQAWQPIHRDIGIPLILAGFPQQQVDRFRARQSHGLDPDSLRILPAIPRTALKVVYTLATALVHPSLAEGFGLTILEAMAMETPVICSDIPALREVAGPDGALFFDPMDIEAIRAAMQAILHNADKVRRLIEYGRSRADAFRWEKAAQTVFGLYESLLDQPLNRFDHPV